MDEQSNNVTFEFSAVKFKLTIEAMKDEMEYWGLSRKERNKIDARRHKEGKPKYKRQF